MLQRQYSKHMVKQTAAVTFSKVSMLLQYMIHSFKTNCNKVVIQHWNCCLQEHESTSGEHYHISGPKRWSNIFKKFDKQLSNHRKLFSEACYILFYIEICFQRE